MKKKYITNLFNWDKENDFYHMFGGIPMGYVWLFFLLLTIILKHL